jgi:biopolymer transport protein TolR
MNDPSLDGEIEETEKINVVPLADLTLVLLIILMVLSPMISQSMIHVSAPTIQESADKTNGGSPDSPPDPLLIELSLSGYRLNNAKMKDLAGLFSAVTAGLGERRDRPLLVRADNAVPVGRVVEVLDGAKQAAKRAGARDVDVSLVGNPEEQ